MKYPAYIDTNATSPVTRVGLQWEADTIIVINPTKYTVAVRVGSGSVPDTSNADMIVAPVSALCLPTEAREFTFIATTPTLTDAPDGMPTRVTLYLTKNEPSPAFGSISLAGQLPRAGVLVDTASSAAIVSHLVVPVPAAIRRLMVSPHAFSGLSARVEITGNQTVTQYYQGHPGGGFDGHTIVELSALDTTLKIEYFPETTGAYTIDIIGFTEYGPIGAYGQDGRQLVNPLAVGATAVPVSLSVPRPDRSSVLLQTVTLRAVAGPVAWGPFATAFVGGLFVLNKSVGDAVSFFVAESPTALFALATSPASAAAASAVAVEIGPGVSGAAMAGGVRVAAQLPQAFFLIVTHTTAVAASYTLTLYPGQ